ncbi:MAG: hypothetical protein EHM20_09130 [Alphaproteobacteria bacterium]|nr:MAG: hypothetical protein EHM20_09130 [Alphaproteobacteria bacterium]
MELMTRKIAITGGPGSGKSATAAHLYVLCKQKGINVDHVHEFAREEINRFESKIHENKD